MVWVGTDQGAYFGSFNETLGKFTETGDHGWVAANTGGSDHNVRVYVDPSGNLWFGHGSDADPLDGGVRSLLSRLLTLSSSRFVGYAAKATVTLLDVNPDTDPPVVYVVKAGAAVSAPELTLAATKNSNGTYSASFGFAEATVPGQKLGVTSATRDSAFEVAYAFGPTGARKELPRARFTWANVVPFDDDAWIGNACFVKSLDPSCAGR